MSLLNDRESENLLLEMEEFLRTRKPSELIELVYGAIQNYEYTNDSIVRNVALSNS